MLFHSREIFIYYYRSSSYAYKVELWPYHRKKKLQNNPILTYGSSVETRFSDPGKFKVTSLFKQPINSFWGPLCGNRRKKSIPSIGCGIISFHGNTQIFLQTRVSV